jgi:VanZ family protein
MSFSRDSAGRFLMLWAPVAGWMLLIFLLSDRPDLPKAPGGLLDFLVKKSMHAAGYAMLALLLWRALRVSDIERPILWALVLTVIYAVTDEWHQTWVEGRNGRVTDVLIDAMGATLALLAVNVRQ